MTQLVYFHYNKERLFFDTIKTQLELEIKET